MRAKLMNSLVCGTDSTATKTDARSGPTSRRPQPFRTYIFIRGH